MKPGSARAGRGPCAPVWQRSGAGRAGRRGCPVSRCSAPPLRRSTARSCSCRTSWPALVHRPHELPRWLSICVKANRHPPSVQISSASQHQGSCPRRRRLACLKFRFVSSPLRRRNEAPQRGRQTEPGPLSRKLHVPAFERRGRIFEVAKCDLKGRTRRTAVPAQRVHRTRRGDDLCSAEQPPGNSDEHPGGQLICTTNKDLAARVEKLERGQDSTASVIEILVEDIDRLGDEIKQMKALPPVKRRKIGFRHGTD